MAFSDGRLQNIALSRSQLVSGVRAVYGNAGTVVSEASPHLAPVDWTVGGDGAPSNATALVCVDGQATMSERQLQIIAQQVGAHGFRGMHLISAGEFSASVLELAQKLGVQLTGACAFCKAVEALPDHLRAEIVRACGGGEKPFAGGGATPMEDPCHAPKSAAVPVAPAVNKGKAEADFESLCREAVPLANQTSKKRKLGAGMTIGIVAASLALLLVPSGVRYLISKVRTAVPAEVREQIPDLPVLEEIKKRPDPFQGLRVEVPDLKSGTFTAKFRELHQDGHDFGPESKFNGERIAEQIWLHARKQVEARAEGHGDWKEIADMEKVDVVEMGQCLIYVAGELQVSSSARLLAITFVRADAACREAGLDFVVRPNASVASVISNLVYQARLNEVKSFAGGEPVKGHELFGQLAGLHPAVYPAVAMYLDIEDGGLTYVEEASPKDSASFQLDPKEALNFEETEDEVSMMMAAVERSEPLEQKFIWAVVGSTMELVMADIQSKSPGDSEMTLLTGLSIPADATLRSTSGYFDKEIAFLREQWAVNELSDPRFQRFAEALVNHRARGLSGPLLVDDLGNIEELAGEVIGSASQHPRFALAVIRYLPEPWQYFGKLHSEILPVLEELQDPLLKFEARCLLARAGDSSQLAAAIQSLQTLLDETEGLSGYSDHRALGIILGNSARRVFERNHSEVAAVVAGHPKVKPWLRDLICGVDLVFVAWDARGKGPASEVTEDAWRVFNAKMEAAGEHLTRSWRSNPDHPTAAAEMVRVAGGLKRPMSEVRQWFDRSIAAQADYRYAYQCYLPSLLPSRNGSDEMMAAFGTACLDTERFDTPIAEFLLSVHQARAKEWTQLGKLYWASRSVEEIEQFRQLFDGWEQAPNREHTRNLDYSMATVVWHATGHYDRMVECLEKIDYKLNKKAVKFSPYIEGKIVAAVRDEKQRQALVRYAAHHGVQPVGEVLAVGENEK